MIFSTNFKKLVSSQGHSASIAICKFLVVDHLNKVKRVGEKRALFGCGFFILFMFLFFIPACTEGFRHCEFLGTIWAILFSICLFIVSAFILYIISCIFNK